MERHIALVEMVINAFISRELRAWSMKLQIKKFPGLDAESSRERKLEAFGNNLAGRQLDARVNQFLIFTISLRGEEQRRAGGMFVGVLCVFFM